MGENDVVRYQCPNCGGALVFSTDTSMLHCNYCQQDFNESDVAASVPGGGGGMNQGPDVSQLNLITDGMHGYSCPSCGAEIVCDVETTATFCPFCGEPTVLSDRVSGMLQPNYIIPFKINRDEAISRLKNYYRGKRLVPSAFSKENEIEKIQGLYVPFWLYSGSVYSSMNFKAKTEHSHISGDYEIVEVDNWRLYREGTIQVDRVPVDGSLKMPDDLMDSIEPFNYYGEDGLKPFSMAYLPGFLADRFDVDVNECSERAKGRIGNSVVDLIQNQIDRRFSGSATLEGNPFHQFNFSEINYVFLPVWILTTRWRDQNFTFAMNGQTGKFTGNLPMDKTKYWLYAGGFAVLFGVIVALIGYLLSATGAGDNIIEALLYMLS